MEREPYDLFVSYARHDDADGRVRELIRALADRYRESAGTELRYFLDTGAIAGMDDWRQRILDAVHDAPLLLACLSPTYFGSEYCAWEFNEFVKLEAAHALFGESLAPVLLADVQASQATAPGGADDWFAELQRRHHFDWRGQRVGSPAARPVVEQLAAQLADRLRRLRLSMAAPGNVARAHRGFVGRRVELHRLRDTVQLGRVGILHGLGGIGKSALALQYAHTFAHEYGGGRWQISCLGRGNLSEALVSLAPDLGIDFQDAQHDVAANSRRVLAELKARTDRVAPHRCLLILDDVDQPALIEPAQLQMLPAAHWLHGLVTTRLAETDLHGGHAERMFIPIGELSDADALSVIEQYQPGAKLTDPAQYAAAKEIVRLLGGYTLAVESAAAFLGHYAGDVSCPAFLARLREEGIAGLDEATAASGVAVLHGEKGVAATLRPTLERLTDAERRALEFAAVLPSECVLWEWIEDVLSDEFDEFDTAVLPGQVDPWAQLQRRLYSLQLLQPSGDEGVARMHAVVQGVVLDQQERGGEHTRARMVEHATRRCEAVVKNWTSAEVHAELGYLAAFARHLLRTDGQRTGPQLDSDQAEPLGMLAGPQLGTELGEALRQLGRYQEAESLLRQSLDIRATILGRRHSDTRSTQHNLGLVLLHLAQLDEAEAIFRELIVVGETSGNPDTAALSCLGSVLQARGDYAGAEPLYRRELEASERVLGPEHPSTLTGVNNLAGLLESQGDYAGAEPLYRRALEACERVLGPEHPSTLTGVNNLACLLERKGDHAGAEPLFRRALEARERVLGPEHPSTLTGVNNLACLLERKGDYAGAEPLYRRALEACERVLGPEHPDTLGSVNNLAYLLGRKGDYAGAEPLFRRALEARERVLGPEHPNTRLFVGNYAACLERLGLDEAAIRARVAEVPKNRC